MIKKLLHVKIRAWTATFRLPLLYSGTGLTSPVPPYSTILGMLGCISGRVVKPNETRLGYYFKSEGTAIDIERTKRLMLELKELKDKKSNKKYFVSTLVPNTVKGDGIAKRQFLVNPELDLYLDNLAFKDNFSNPENIPAMGRSQDISWIELVEEINCKEVSTGKISGTMLPFPTTGATGIILVLPEWFDNYDTGYTRSIGNIRRFITIKAESPAEVTTKNLFEIENTGQVIYMHNLYENS